MKNYLRILKPTKVYTSHELTSGHVKILDPDTIISFNREKRRNKVNWMEIYLEDKKVAYIKKEHDNFYKCEDSILDDISAKGFSLNYKTEEVLPFDSLFFLEGTLTKTENIGTVKLENIEDDEDGKSIYIYLEYDKNLLEITPIVLSKKEQFYVTNNIYGKNNIFIEIDNFKGKKGFILKKTNYTDKADSWVKPVSIITMIIVVGGLILAGLSAGWLVISGLMLIPAVIAAFIVVFVLQIVIMIVKGIFQKIRKRF
ncbi:hypothetical protein [Tenacibaculum ovolyticum]|uniref:hypothetical protein n=1 Tax=Tenacibaculum ovolyticum TaxID=104270 RepID=UPI0007ECD1A6|nr:hypothetical protein [Tenacibaculum ovolyticum]